MGRCSRLALPTRRALLAASGITLSAAALHAQSANAAAVCTGRWADATPLLRDGKPVYIERGVVTGFRGRSLLLGTPTIFWLAKDHYAPMDRLTAADSNAVRYAFSRSGAVVDTRGIADGTPPVGTLRVLRRPRVVAESERTLTVGWEVYPRDSSATFRMQGTAVALSRWDGERWSPIELLHDGRETRFMLPVAHRPGARRASVLTAAVVRGSDARSRIHVVRRGPPGWRETSFSDRISVLDVAVVDALDGTTSVLFAGSHDNGAVSESGLFQARIVWRTDGSSFWEPPVLLQRASQFGPPAVAKLGADSIVVGWGGGQATPSFRITSDGGRSWDLIAPPDGASAVDLLVVDATGRLHLLYRAANRPEVLNAPGSILHAIWQGGRWSAPADISGGESMTAPDAGPTPDGGIVAVWTLVTPGSMGPMPRSQARRWTPECGSR